MINRSMLPQKHIQQGYNIYVSKGCFLQSLPWQRSDSELHIKQPQPPIQPGPCCYTYEFIKSLLQRATSNSTSHVLQDSFHQSRRVNECACVCVCSRRVGLCTDVAEIEICAK